MGGSPILTESRPMVSSPLHVTISLTERLVKTHHSTGFDSLARAGFSDNKTSRKLHSLSSGSSLMSDDSQGSTSDFAYHGLLRKSSLISDKPETTKHVAFGDICTRSYSVVLGDHPCCQLGCPLQLGWNYDRESSVSVDEYEASRSPRRSREDLRTTWDERRTMLADVSDGEVKRAERKLHRERSCSRKRNQRVCAAFFSQDLPDDCKAAAQASKQQTPQFQCT